MADIFDYLKWRGDITMEAVPFCDADRLILSELAYIDFENEYARPLGELCREVIKKVEIVRESGAKMKLLHHKKDEELLLAVAESPRFMNLTVAHCESRISRDREEQFAAMTVYLPDKSAVCVFRGTDWSIVGWKEDFMMSYSDSLPAQRSAVAYLTRVSRIHGGPLRVTGHSKGGNLAVYAAAFAGKDIRERVIDITSLDGPGFCEKVTDSYEYSLVSDRVRTFMPKASIVGVLFSRTGKFTVIESRASGLMQHIPYNWEIMGDGFVTASEQDGSSQLVEESFNEWIRAMSIDERRLFIDTVWSGLVNLRVNEFYELLDGKNVRAVFKNYSALDEDSRRLISETLSKLRGCAKESLRELISAARAKKQSGKPKST